MAAAGKRDAGAVLDIEKQSLSSSDQIKAATGLGLRIAFKGLDYTVKKDIKLLDNVTAYAEPYQMTALMGPSGSGKTTLLDVLAGRKSAGTISGDIRFGHAKPSAAFLRRYTGYVEQFDSLIGSLTVAEMLMYTAELKRSVAEPHSSKQEAVRQLLDRLGLSVCADVVIGDPLTKGISGGQAKRTNIGIALIANPRVLFLDEPTSGLDSYTSNEVVRLMHSLSRDGTTVVATIHSPTASAFAMFDRVLMLVRGLTVYFGPRESSLVFAQQHWLGTLGTLGKEAQGESSLAEFLVDIITDADRAGKGREIADAYQASGLCKENEVQVDAYISNSCMSFKKRSMVSLPPAASDEDVRTSPQDVKAVIKHTASNVGRDGASDEAAVLDAQLATRSATSTPWWWGLLVLLRYRARVNYKNPVWVGPRVADKFWFTFIIFTLYLKTGDDFSQANLVNLCASLFMWCTLPAFGAVGYVPSIVLERKLFYRERADGLYHVGTYLVAKLVEELILATFISVAFSATVFYAVQYQGSFALFWLVYLLTLAIGIALGYLVAALAPSMDVANAALPAYVTGVLFFAGQLATLDSIPVYWQWFSTVDFVRYAWSALMTNQFRETNPPFTADGVTVLEYYSITHGAEWKYFSLLFAFFGTFALLGYLALSYIRHGSR